MTRKGARDTCPETVDPPVAVTGPSFSEELTRLINRHSMENNSDTPDFILAKFMRSCQRAFDSTTKERDSWMGRERFKPGQSCKEGEA